jgi:molybdopterin-guanine dinucleotide biosynthesis protein A
MTLVPVRAVAVVLGGGTARRFGRDKLAEPLGADAPTLLDAALAALPEGLEVVVVGPERPTVRAVGFVREDPPGGGPAAALVTGLRFALAQGAEVIAVLPADAPRAGQAAVQLVDHLRGHAHLTAVVGVDAEGREQPLQLALSASAARRLVAAAPDGGHGASARALLRSLDPPAEHVALEPDVLFDIDTPAQLAVWRAQSSAAVETVLEHVAEVGARRGRTPAVVVALAGVPGSGRSTLADALRLRTGATVLPAEDFSEPQRLRQALATLDGLVVLDGVGSAAPQLADLVDVAVLVTAHGPGAGERDDGAPLHRGGAFDLVVTATEIGDASGA